MKTFCFEFWKKERKREKSYWDLNLNSLSKGVSHDLNILKTTVFFFTLSFFHFILFSSCFSLPATHSFDPHPSPDLFPNLLFSHSVLFHFPTLLMHLRTVSIQKAGRSQIWFHLKWFSTLSLTKHQTNLAFRVSLSSHYFYWFCSLCS